MTDGIMDFHQFVVFLESHRVNEQDSLFDHIDRIYELYLEMKLKNACCGQSVRNFSCLR
jgi:hypothetical protein